jgi:hypothetical protein
MWASRTKKEENFKKLEDPNQDWKYKVNLTGIQNSHLC